jgi:hypothetical protein
MSQVQTPTAQVNVPPAFQRVPINPHTAKVQEELQKMNTQPAPESVTAPIQDAIRQQTLTSTQPVTSPPAPVETLPPPPPPTPHVQYDPQMLYALQQAEAERERLAQENVAAQQTIQNLLSKQEELELLKQRQELQKSLSKEAFAELQTVDPEDAQRITHAVLNSLTPTLAEQRKELEKTKKQLADNQAQMQQRLAHAQVQQTNQRIMAVHPDFFKLQETPAYHAFMSQRDGLSHQTRDQRAAQEFNAGNADYVIDLLNQLKGAVPSAASIATVAPVQTAISVSTAAATQPAPTMTLGELNSLYQMRQISHDEYRAKLKELRAAAKQ